MSSTRTGLVADESRSALIADNVLIPLCIQLIRVITDHMHTELLHNNDEFGNTTKQGRSTR